LPTEHAVTLAGNTLQLLGQRALWWPARQALLIADLHLGKADTLRRAGILTPRGTTTGDLERLGALIARCRPQTLWVLGDLLHGPLHAAPWLDAWQAFRVAHAGMAVRVIAGNHDRRLDAAQLGVEVQGAPVDLDGLRLCHDGDDHSPLPTISGHCHPTVKLPGVPRRWPAFLLRERGLVLPAFSAFTGGGPLPQDPTMRLVACVEGELVVVPATLRRRSARG
jgi:uncharacterized protein